MVDYITISGPYESEEEAIHKLNKHYGGEEGPYWVEETRPGVWFIVVETEYYYPDGYPED